MQSIDQAPENRQQGFENKLVISGLTKLMNEIHNSEDTIPDQKNMENFSTLSPRTTISVDVKVI